jgi:hypothetical protein
MIAPYRNSAQNKPDFDKKSNNYVTYSPKASKSQASTSSTASTSSGMSLNLIKPPPNPKLKSVSSKVNSLANLSYKTKGGNKKVAHQPVVVGAVTSKVNSLANVKYQTKGGKNPPPTAPARKVDFSKVGPRIDATPPRLVSTASKVSKKLAISQKPDMKKVKSKVGSLDNIKYETKGGKKKVESNPLPKFSDLKPKINATTPESLIKSQKSRKGVAASQSQPVSEKGENESVDCISIKSEPIQEYESNPQHPNDISGRSNEFEKFQFDLGPSEMSSLSLQFVEEATALDVPTGEDVQLF